MMLRVQLQQLRFLAQRSRLARAHREAGAQQVGEPRQQPVRALHVGLHQRRDGVQRIEQEVRLQLRLELRELRLGQVLLHRSRRSRSLLPQAKLSNPKMMASHSPVNSESLTVSYMNTNGHGGCV